MSPGQNGEMSIIKINAITVPSDSGDELARRFAARLGAVDGQPGFGGFELLAPTDGRDQWLVVTRWDDEESYQSWLASADFRAGHGHGPGEAPAPERPKPVGVASEIWSYRVAVTSQE